MWLSLSEQAWRGEGRGIRKGNTGIEVPLLPPPQISTVALYCHLSRSAGPDGGDHLKCRLHRTRTSVFTAMFQCVHSAWHRVGAQQIFV